MTADALYWQERANEAEAEAEELREQLDAAQADVEDWKRKCEETERIVESVVSGLTTIQLCLSGLLPLAGSPPEPVVVPDAPPAEVPSS